MIQGSFSTERDGLGLGILLGLGAPGGVLLEAERRGEKKDFEKFGFWENFFDVK